MLSFNSLKEDVRKSLALVIYIVKTNCSLTIRTPDVCDSCNYCKQTLIAVLLEHSPKSFEVCLPNFSAPKTRGKVSHVAQQSRHDMEH